MSWKQIIEGWKNHLVPEEEMKEVIKQVSEERMLICEACPMHSKHLKNSLRPDAHCVSCGCTLSAKTKCLSCQCPIHKWMPVIIEEYKTE